MPLRNLFFNDYGRLRSGWRIICFVALCFVFYFFMGYSLRIATGILDARHIQIPHEKLVADFISRFFLLVVALSAGYVCARWLEGLPWESLGLTRHKHWFRDFLIGSAIGALSLALAVAIAVAAGGFQFSMSGVAILGPVMKSLVGSAAMFIVAALAEEAIFRGYPLQTLCRAKLVWLGVLLTFGLFAGAHLGNPNASLGFPFVNTALAGVWLAIAYLRTRSLWLPLGVHWSWNWALGSLFGLPVSGMTLVPHPLIIGKDLGPAWITGGNYGIEGGAAATVALLLSSLFIWRTTMVSATPELLSLTSAEVPVFASRLRISEISATDSD